MRALQAVVLMVHSSAECRLRVDGKDRGIPGPNKALRLKLAAGKHTLEADPAAGGNRWMHAIALSSAQAPQEVTIDLSGRPTYWVDGTSNTMWTLADNGSGLSWSQAIRYCRDLDLDGFRDWRLPQVDELQGIFNTAPSEDAYHVKGPLKLTGWQWSATAGQQAGEGWAFDFGDGGRASVAAGDSGLNRALCVRSAP